MIDDIRYLVVFAKTAELGSFSNAASALGITTATVSQHVSRLEKSLNRTLMYRNTRKLSLTPDGARLLDTAKQMLELYDEGVLELKRGPTAQAEVLRVAVPAILNRSPFPEAIARFAREHLDTRIHVSCSDLRSDIIGEGFDVAFRIGEMPDSSLKSKFIFEFSRTVVASPTLLGSLSTLKEPRDLIHAPWIGLSMRPSNRRFTHLSGESQQIRYVPRIFVDNIKTAYSLAKCGAGLTVPPEFLAKEDLDRGIVERVLPEWTLEPMKVYAVWPPNTSSKIVPKLVRIVAETVGRSVLLSP